MPSRSLLLVLFLTLAGMARAVSTEVSTDQPIVNFRIPDFTPEGYRAWLVRGSEARYHSEKLVSVKELNLTIFDGQSDGKIETLILSPAAEIQLGDMVARGPDTIRIINDRFEATGADWAYSHNEKKVSIARNVHVILHTELKDILK